MSPMNLWKILGTKSKRITKRRYYPMINIGFLGMVLGRIIRLKRYLKTITFQSLLLLQGLKT